MELSQSELEKLLEEGSDRSSWPFLTCVEDLRNQDYALLEAPFKADRAPFCLEFRPETYRISEFRSVLEALQGRERWQPEFPEFETDTMGRSFLENKVGHARTLQFR